MLLRITILCLLFPLGAFARIGGEAAASYHLQELPITLPGLNHSDSHLEKMSNNAHFFAQMTLNNELNLWSLTESSKILNMKLPINIGVNNFSISPRSDLIIIEAINSLMLISISKGEVIGTFQTAQVHNGSSIFALSPDEKTLAYVIPGKGTWVEIFDLVTMSQKSFFKADDYPITALALHPVHSTIAIKSSHRGLITVRDFHGELIQRFESGDDLSDQERAFTPSLIWNNNGTMLATHSTKSQQAVVWDTTNNNIIYDFAWISELPMQNTSYNNILIGNIEGDLNILQDNNMYVISPFGPFDLVSSVALSPHGEFVTLASEDGLIAVYDAHSLEQLCLNMSQEHIEITQIAFFADMTFYAVTDNKELGRWDISRTSKAEQ